MNRKKPFIHDPQDDLRILYNICEGHLAPWWKTGTNSLLPHYNSPDFLREVERCLIKIASNSLLTFFSEKQFEWVDVVADVNNRIFSTLPEESKTPDESEKILMRNLFSHTIDGALDSTLCNLLPLLNISTRSKSRKRHTDLLIKAWDEGGDIYQRSLEMMMRGLQRRCGWSLMPIKEYDKLENAFTQACGWLAISLETTIKINPPKYALIIPATIQIAYIHQKINN